MDLVPIEVAREFDARDEFKIQIVCRSTRRSDTADNVMISDSESGKTNPVGLGN